MKIATEKASLQNYFSAVWAAILAEIRAIPAGVDLGENRSMRIFTRAARLGSFIPHHAWTSATILQALVPLAEERQIQDAERQIRNGIAAGEKEPADLSKIGKLLPRKEMRPLLSNVIHVQTEEGKDTTKPRPIGAIVDQIHTHTNNWPRVCTDTPFAIVGDSANPRVRWLSAPPDLFAWLGGSFDLAWKKSTPSGAPVAKSELLSEIQSAGKRYHAISTMPHHPSVSGVYYKIPTTENYVPGVALLQFMGSLNAETDLDRGLLLAAVLTPAWGGPPGARPAFVLTSDYGRGSGKTATAQAIARVWGGSIQVQPYDDPEVTKQRLLSLEAASKRVLICDNLKGRISNGALESLITVDNISGKKLYVGEQQRPNYLTWIFTANTPQLSADLAARSYVVKIGKPKHNVDFEGSLRALDMAHVRADCVALLQKKPTVDPSKIPSDRFMLWQREVLSRVAEAISIVSTNKSRQGELDEDLQSAEDLAASLRLWVEDNGIPNKKGEYFVPGKDLVLICDPLWPDLRKNSRRMWPRVRALLGMGSLGNVERVRRSGGYGLLLPPLEEG